MKLTTLTIGEKYKVKYKPTKYLYSRVGILVLKTDKSLKFDLEDDGHYFLVQPKHLVGITLANEFEETESAKEWQSLNSGYGR